MWSNVEWICTCTESLSNSVVVNRMQLCQWHQNKMKTSSCLVMKLVRINLLDIISISMYIYQWLTGINRNVMQERLMGQKTVRSLHLLKTLKHGMAKEKQVVWLSRAEECNVAWLVLPEPPFCMSPLLSSSRLSPSPWIPITVAVDGGLKTE